MKTQNTDTVSPIHARSSRRLVAALGAGLLLTAGSSFLRLEAAAQTTTIVNTETTVNGSTTSHLDSRELAALPEGISITPAKSEAGPSGGGGMVGSNQKLLGHGMSLSKVIAFAYDTDAAKVVLPADGLPGKFDVVVNVAEGGKEKLQAELQKQFGITARRETRNADVLVLGVQQANATGFKPSESQAGSVTGGTRVQVSSSSSSSSSASSSSSSSSGNESRHSASLSAKGQNLAALIKNLQSHFDKPIVDRTGLTGKYDLTLQWSATTGTSASDALKLALAEQAGLSLTPANEPMEVLVVEKK